MYLIPPCSGHGPSRSVLCADLSRDSGAASGSNCSEPRKLIAGATGRWHRFKPAKYRFQEFLFAPSTKIEFFPREGRVGSAFKPPVPMALTVAAETSVEQLLELVVDSEVDHAPDAEPAGVCTACSRRDSALAKNWRKACRRCWRLSTNRVGTAIFDPPLVKIEASAVQHCRKDIVRSLKVVGEAHIPLSTGTQTRFRGVPRRARRGIPLRSSSAIGLI